MRVAVITAEVVLEQKKGQRVRNPASGLPSPAHGAGAGPQVPVLQEGPQPQGGVAPGRTRAPQPYHSVLVLLRGIVHSRVPHVGVGGVHLARIQLPVPGKREQIPSVIPWLCCCSPAIFLPFPAGSCLKGLGKRLPLEPKELHPSRPAHAAGTNTQHPQPWGTPDREIAGLEATGPSERLSCAMR